MPSDYRTHAQMRLEKALAEAEKWKLVLKGLDEIDQARESEGSGASTVTATLTPPPARVNGVLHVQTKNEPTVSERIWAAVEALSPNEFTVPEIEDWLRENQGYEVPGKYARSRIVTILKDFRLQKKVVRTAAPTGGKPHRFKKVDETDVNRQFGDLLGVSAEVR